MVFVVQPDKFEKIQNQKKNNILFLFIVSEIHDIFLFFILILPHFYVLEKNFVACLIVTYFLSPFRHSSVEVYSNADIRLQKPGI